MTAIRDYCAGKRNRINLGFECTSLVIILCKISEFVIWSVLHRMTMTHDSSRDTDSMIVSPRSESVPRPNLFRGHLNDNPLHPLLTYTLVSRDPTTGKKRGDV